LISREDIEAFEYFSQTEMEMNVYQNAAAQTAIYKHEHQVIYPALGLAAEAGEVANKVKRYYVMVSLIVRLLLMK